MTKRRIKMDRKAIMVVSITAALAALLVVPLSYGSSTEKHHAMNNETAIEHGNVPLSENTGDRKVLSDSISRNVHTSSKQQTAKPKVVKIMQSTLENTPTSIKRSIFSSAQKTPTATILKKTRSKKRLPVAALQMRPEVSSSNSDLAATSSRKRNVETHDNNSTNGLSNELSKSVPPPTAMVLTRAVILKEVQRQIKSLKSCLVNARSRRELAPGTITLNLEWSITPEGRVVEARLLGPTNVQKTSLTSCIPSMLETKWQFSPSVKRTNISRFSLGPIRIH